jgi:hypothetical protein
LSAQVPTALTAAYPVKVGDMAAAALSEFLKLRSDFKDPAIVTFEPGTGTIDVEVFASPAYGSKTDQARSVLGKYWEFIQAGHLPYVQRRLNAKLTAEHFRLMYYDAKAQGGPQLVLQFVNGQYLIP